MNKYFIDSSLQIDFSGKGILVAKQAAKQINKRLAHLNKNSPQCAQTLALLIKNLINSNSINSLYANKILVSLTHINKLFDMLNQIRNILDNEINLCSEEIKELQDHQNIIARISQSKEFIKNNHDPDINDKIGTYEEEVIEQIKQLQNEKALLTTILTNDYPPLREKLYLKIMELSKTKAIFESKELRDTYIKIWEKITKIFELISTIIR